jgi:hypothetical protein
MLAVQPYRVIKGQANVTLGCVGKRGGASTFVCQGKSDFAVIDPSAQLPYCWVALTVENQDLPVEWPSDSIGASQKSSPPRRSLDR